MQQNLYGKIFFNFRKPLPMAKKTTLPKKVKEDVINYINVLKDDKLPIKKVIVFGSRARRNARGDSDIDVCIISPKFKNNFEALHYLLMKSYQVKALIEPHPYHPKNFIDDDPLVWEIKKTGITIE